jgi:hypothetical protein
MGFEPSQVGTLVGTLMDACIPLLSKIPTTTGVPDVGLSKHVGILGEREGYPDYLHARKESEGRHFNEDTNFGKLKRIPYKPLQDFLKKHIGSIILEVDDDLE